MILVLIPLESVNALTRNADGTFTNKKGIIITSEEYDNLSKVMKDDTIDLLSENGVMVFSNKETFHKGSIEYSITTDMIKNGVVVESKTIKATKEEAELVKNNKNIHILSDNKLHDTSKELEKYNKDTVNQIRPYSNITEDDDTWIYQTNSKRVKMGYGDLNGTLSAYMEVEWFTIPMIKKYDILAMRWDTSINTSNITNYSGSQTTSDSNGNSLVAEYDEDSENFKVTSKGLGQIMNIFDDATDEIYMQIFFEPTTSCGNWMYGSYQHARHSSITLSAAKSYTFSASGLGGVVYFSNSTTRGYYDGMDGVKDHSGDGPEYQW